MSFVGSLHIILSYKEKNIVVN